MRSNDERSASAVPASGGGPSASVERERGTTDRREFLTAAAAATGAAMLPSMRPRPVRAGEGSGSASPTVLLWSGWQTVNIGDVGHTPGTLRYLEQHMPDCRVILWLSTTNDEVTAMLRQRFPDVSIVRGRMNAAGEGSTPELQAALDEADLLLHNSGMHFNRFWGGGPVRQMQAWHASGRPFCCYGQSFDGFKEEGQEDAMAVLSNATAIYTRDIESLYYLRNVGVHPAILEFGPDGCFGIDVRDEARAEAFLAEHGLEEGDFLSVTLRSNTPKSSGSSDELNPAERSEAEVAEDERWSGKLRQIIVSWVESTGRKVLLAPEVDKEIEPARRQLLDRLPERVQRNVVHRQTFWNVDEAASVYARARALVSMEPHSCIIGLANGTPSLHYFSPKHGLKAWMFRDIGLPEWLFNIDEEPAEHVTAALRQIDADPARAGGKVERAMAFVDQRSKEMMADLRRVL